MFPCRSQELFDATAPKRIVVVAPHPDDETLGAGGTIAKCTSLGHEVSVLIVSGHLPPIYSRDAYETTVREAREAFDILGVVDFSFLEIPATLIGNEPVHVLNEKVSSVIHRAKPQVVLSCFPDRHIDHRLIFDSVMVATRPVGVGAAIELLAVYETPSETHWNAPHIEPNFVPNWVVDISEHISIKLKALACYRSQVTAFPGSRSIEAVEALGKFRGTQSGFAFGEAFQIVRMTS